MCCNPSLCLPSLCRRRKFSSSFMHRSTRFARILCSLSLVFSFVLVFQSRRLSWHHSLAYVTLAAHYPKVRKKRLIFLVFFHDLEKKGNQEAVSRVAVSGCCFAAVQRIWCHQLEGGPKLKTKVWQGSFFFFFLGQDLGARSGLDNEELVRTVKSLSLGKVFEQMSFLGLLTKRKQGSSSCSWFWGSRHGANQRKRNLFVEKGFQAQDAAHQDQLHPGARDCRGERSGTTDKFFYVWFHVFDVFVFALFRCEKLFRETESIRSTLQLCASWKRAARCRIRSCWRKFTRKSSFPWNRQTSKSRLNRSSIENTSPETTKGKRTIIWHKRKGNFFKRVGV